MGHGVVGSTGRERMLGRDVALICASLTVVAAGVSFALLAYRPWERTWLAAATAVVGLALVWHNWHRYLAVTGAGTLVVANGIRDTTRVAATNVATLQIAPASWIRFGIVPTLVGLRDGRTLTSWGVAWDPHHGEPHAQRVHRQLQRVAERLEAHGATVLVLR